MPGSDPWLQRAWLRGAMDSMDAMDVLAAVPTPGGHGAADLVDLGRPLAVDVFW